MSDTPAAKEPSYRTGKRRQFAGGTSTRLSGYTVGSPDRQPRSVSIPPGQRQRGTDGYRHIPVTDDPLVRAVVLGGDYVRAKAERSGTLDDMTDDPDARKPIADVLPGLELHPLTPGATALEAFVLIKLLDDEGHSTWAYRTTHRLNREELLGALVVHVDVLRKELLDEWTEE